MYVLEFGLNVSHPLLKICIYHSVSLPHLCSPEIEEINPFAFNLFVLDSGAAKRELNIFFLLSNATGQPYHHYVHVYLQPFLTAFNRFSSCREVQIFLKSKLEYQLFELNQQVNDYEEIKTYVKLNLIIMFK